MNFKSACDVECVHRRKNITPWTKQHANLQSSVDLVLMSNIQTPKPNYTTCAHAEFIDASLASSGLVQHAHMQQKYTFPLIEPSDGDAAQCWIMYVKVLLVRDPRELSRAKSDSKAQLCLKSTVMHHMGCTLHHVRRTTVAYTVCMSQLMLCIMRCQPCHVYVFSRHTCVEHITPELQTRPPLLLTWLTLIQIAYLVLHYACMLHMTWRHKKAYLHQVLGLDLWFFSAFSVTLSFLSWGMHCLQPTCPWPKYKSNAQGGYYAAFVH